MKQAHTFLKILNEVFPYVGMKPDFCGVHCLSFSKEKENAVDILVWHLGRAWPCTATLDEFEVWASASGAPEPDELREKTEEELKAFALKMKGEIENLAAAKLAKLQ